MKLILLPGLDGTGRLFAPLINALPKTIDIEIISYPCDKKLSYKQLISLVLGKLPKIEEYILLAESFSGHIAQSIAFEKPKNLKSLIFVATFLENPRPILSKLLPILPLKFMLNLPITISSGLLLDRNSDKTISSLLQKTLKSVDVSVLHHRLLEITKLIYPTKTINIKSIYIQAKDDKVVPKKCYEQFKKSFLDIKCYRVSGSHLILQNNPIACAKIIIFLIK